MLNVKIELYTGDRAVGERVEFKEDSGLDFYRIRRCFPGDQGRGRHGKGTTLCKKRWRWLWEAINGSVWMECRVYEESSEVELGGRLLDQRSPGQHLLRCLSICSCINPPLAGLLISIISDLAHIWLFQKLRTLSPWGIPSRPDICWLWV